MACSIRTLTLVLTALLCGSARSEDIGAVLERSQQQRLAHVESADADAPRTQQVRDSFDRLLRRLQWAHPVELRVIRAGGALAETLRGDVVLASESLADLPETERLFILAHELGHVSLEHWSQVGLMFQKWVPGEVTQAHTDAVAALLGRDASKLAHQQEFEADAFALRLLRELGIARDAVVAVFARAGLRPDTVTHPGTRKRVGALLVIDADDAAGAGRRAQAPQ